MNGKFASFLIFITLITINCGKPETAAVNSQQISQDPSPIEALFSGSSSPKKESTWSQQKKMIEEQKRMQEKRMQSYKE